MLQFQISVDAVDIDSAVVKIAKDWFEFREDETMKVHIADGIEYVKNLVKQGWYLKLVINNKLKHFSLQC